MPTLLQINVTANWGSTGKIAEQIGYEAIRQGWNSYIAYGRISQPSTSKLIKIGGKLNTYSHYLSQRILDNEGLCSQTATKQLIRRIKEIKPDIVHLHNIHDHYLNYQILFDFLNKYDIKVVWTMHDFWAVTGHCTHFVNAECDKYKTECHDCPMRKIYPKSIIDNSTRNFRLKKELFNNNKNLNIVAVSRWVSDILKTSFLKYKPVYVIYNGVNINDFKPTYNSSLTTTFGSKFVILSVASQWKFDKGLEDYYKIAKMLRSDEIIVLVGVDDEIKKKLPFNIVGIKLTNDISKLASLYTRADVLTVLSSAETFGLTIVEANACGTPAVVYNNTAPPSLITEKTGFVVENHNYKAVYDAISHIRFLGKAYYSDACIRLVNDKYDKQQCIKQYLSLYNNLLAN